MTTPAHLRRLLGNEVLAVMDTDGRAVAMLADACVGARQTQWELHLLAHDDARATVATLITERQELLARVERAEAQLSAYQRAVNRIDDRTEYREFTKSDIRKVMHQLTCELAATLTTPEPTR